jgi:hypothetical protein
MDYFQLPAKSVSKSKLGQHSFHLQRMIFVMDTQDWNLSERLSSVSFAIACCGIYSWAISDT